MHGGSSITICTQCTVHDPLPYVHNAQGMIHSQMYSMYSIVHISLSEVHNVQCTIHYHMYTMYSAKFITLHT
jgi:hypothetical protein